MGRAPCCEKMGLNRGPWSHEEDQLLISYIQQHGHPNWRALPKHAGLLRCGKSCRLRWINYLRPDIKRGNFTKEEEDTIFRLHEMLGNRWSLIAAKLPGRTDNEIKNVWHTHLKKRLENQETNTRVSRKRQAKSILPASNAQRPEKTIGSECSVHPEDNFVNEERFVSNQPSSSESSSITEETTDSPGVTKHDEIDHETLLDDSFWLETLSGEGNNNMEFNPTTSIPGVEFPTAPLTMIENTDTRMLTTSCDMDGMDPWYDIFVRIEELPELPEF